MLSCRISCIAFGKLGGVTLATLRTMHTRLQNANRPLSVFCPEPITIPFSVIQQPLFAAAIHDFVHGD